MSRSHKKSTSPILRTIRCHLNASEDILRQVWSEMTQKNTPLIVQLLKSISEQPEFVANKESGKITKAEITELRKSLLKDLDLGKQSSRLYSSVDNLAKEIYSSWLTLYKKRKCQKEGKEYFLNNILKSDAELVEESKSDLKDIRSKAKEILAQPEEILQEIIIENENLKQAQSKQIEKSEIISQSSQNKQNSDTYTSVNTNTGSSKTLTNILYEIHKTTHDVLTRCAVAYLLKNYNKISEDEEKIKNLKKRRTQKEVEIKRLEKQLKSNQLPTGRDITEEIYLEAFDNLINQVPQDNDEFANWIADLSRKISSVPYPIDFLYSDLSWYKNDDGNIFVYFNGWGKHHFQICCNKRQRHFFERFSSDYNTWKVSEKGSEKLSGSLITLRCAQLLWQKREGKGKPWKVHKLALHCTYDVRLWTAEGTEEVRQEKIDKTKKQVSKTENDKDLDKKQQTQLKKNKSSLSRLDNSFTRPSKPIYQGQANIILSVAFHPVELVTLAVVDTNAQKIIAYKTVKQLLGNDFHLLSRRRREQVHLHKQRKKAQKKDAPSNRGESELGEYVDQLIAKRIIETAKFYRAASIVLPKLKDTREIRTSIIQAKAETKFPGNVNRQKLYTKEYSRQIHNWSYSRLQQCIKSKAALLKINIEFTTQSNYGTLQEIVRDLAFSAYQCRITTIDR